MFFDVKTDAGRGGNTKLYFKRSCICDVKMIKYKYGASCEISIAEIGRVESRVPKYLGETFQFIFAGDSGL